MAATKTVDVLNDNILIVTQNPRFQQSVHDALNKKGFKINSTESSGRKFKELVNELIPGLVIVDMAHLTGAMQTVLRLHGWANVRTLLLKLGEGEKKFSKLDLDATGYDSCPFNTDDLASLVTAILKQRSFEI